MLHTESWAIWKKRKNNHGKGQGKGEENTGLTEVGEVISGRQCFSPTIPFHVTSNNLKVQWARLQFCSRWVKNTGWLVTQTVLSDTHTHTHGGLPSVCCSAMLSARCYWLFSTEARMKRVSITAVNSDGDRSGGGNEWGDSTYCSSSGFVHTHEHMHRRC